MGRFSRPPTSHHETSYHCDERWLASRQLLQPEAGPLETLVRYSIRPEDGCVRPYNNRGTARFIDHWHSCANSIDKLCLPGGEVELILERYQSPN